MALLTLDSAEQTNCVWCKQNLAILLTGKNSNKKKLFSSLPLLKN
jgi:hypothetical protein